MGIFVPARCPGRCWCKDSQKVLNFLWMGAVKCWIRNGRIGKVPRLAATLPIKWTIVKDPVDNGTVVNANDPSAAGGKYGSADIVTKKEFRDFRAHVEFLIVNPGGNSGVYLQNRYEIQVLDGDSTKHGLACCD